MCGGWRQGCKIDVSAVPARGGLACSHLACFHGMCQKHCHDANLTRERFGTCCPFFIWVDTQHPVCVRTCIRASSEATGAVPVEATMLLHDEAHSYYLLCSLRASFKVAVVAVIPVSIRFAGDFRASSGSLASISGRHACVNCTPTAYPKALYNVRPPKRRPTSTHERQGVTVVI